MLIMIITKAAGKKYDVWPTFGEHARKFMHPVSIMTVSKNAYDARRRIERCSRIMEALDE